MDGDGRICFTEQVATLRSRACLSLADVGRAAHVARGTARAGWEGQVIVWPPVGEEKRG